MKTIKSTFSVSVYPDKTFGFTYNGGGTRKRKDISTLFLSVRNRILSLKETRYNVPAQNLIDVAVYEDGYLSNSGTYTDKKEALYAMSCFLEDYLSADTL